MPTRPLGEVFLLNLSANSAKLKRARRLFGSWPILWKLLGVVSSGAILMIGNTGSSTGAVSTRIDRYQDT